MHYLQPTQKRSDQFYVKKTLKFEVFERFGVDRPVIKCDYFGYTPATIAIIYEVNSENCFDSL